MAAACLYIVAMRALILLFLSCLCLPLQAAQLAIILSGEEGPYREFLGSFKGALVGSDWQISWEGSPEKFSQSPPAAVDLIISAGAPATRVALAQAEAAPVIATLLSRTSYEDIVSSNPPHRAGVTALYLDQPLHRQIAFIQHLLPDSRRVMSLVSEKLADQLPALRRLGQQAQLLVDAAVLGQNENLVPALERLLREDGVFIALPDSSIYTRDNIRPFLLTTYRYQRPVVAFSAAFVQAGALAALHTTPAQLALELSQWLRRLRQPLRLPPPQGPSRFSVVINSQVARSLKLSLPSEAEILTSLNGMPGEKP